MTMLTLRYDLRRPEFSTATHAELYAACLDQCAWGEEHGFDVVVLSEHHGVDDGFLPSPLTMAGAVAGRTRRVPIFVNALLAAFYDPLRLAEDLAVLDLASGGRVCVVAGLGYRPEEFEAFGVDRTRRGKVVDEHLDTLLAAWTGEPFEYRGRTVRVTPRPTRDPSLLLFVGGSTRAAARRAARRGLHFFPAVGDPELERMYREECEAAGRPPGMVLLPSGPGFVHVTEDPERDWARIAPHAMHEATTYASWQTDDQRSQVHTDAHDAGSLRASGQYLVLTPDECVEYAQSAGPAGTLVFHPLMGGMPPELGWEGLELFASKVLPRIRPS